MRIELVRLAGILWVAMWLAGCGAVTDNSPKQTATTPSAIRTQALGMNQPGSGRGSVLGSRARVSNAYGQLPRRFEANQGQTNSQVKFLSRGQGYSLFLTDHEAVIMLRGRQPSVVSRQLPKTLDGGDRLASHTRQLSGLLAPPKLSQLQSPIRLSTDNRQSAAGAMVPAAVLRMRLVGANPTAKVLGLDELPGKSNYFIGNDPNSWRTNVPNYARVKYKGVYPGVDLVYYGNQQQLEYDFVVAPGADPHSIRLSLAGARGVEVDSQTGDLVIQAGKDSVRFKKPIVYQLPSGKGKRTTDRTFVEGHYLLARDEVNFEIASYDKTRPLIIDPVLSYATYLGGSNGYDAAIAVAVDGSGNAYVAGITFSTDFPTTAGAFQRSLAGGRDDSFVSKLSSDGSTLLYSTYLGGNDDDRLSAIAIDQNGNAYVTGWTTSKNFPTVNAFQAAPPTGSGAFVTKLNATGSALVYSTYLGGSNDDAAGGIAVNAAGNAFVSGHTSSVNFPTTPGSFQPLGPLGGARYNAFVTELSADGSALVYSTYLGGSGFTMGTAIAVDSSGSAYVTGEAEQGFQLAGSLQFPCLNTAFVSKFSPDGSSLLYSTCLGSGATGRAIAVDSSSSAYVTGEVRNANSFIPTTPGAFQTSPNFYSSAFVTKLNAAGSALVYSTYLSGTNSPNGGGDFGKAIALDANGDAFVGGFTGASDFPTVNSIQATSGGGARCGMIRGCNNIITGATGDAFVAELNPAGSALLFSTYFGGSSDEGVTGMALDSVGNIYFAGETDSTDLPTISPLQASLGGGISDAFVAKIAPADNPAAFVSPASLVFSNQALNTNSTSQTVTIRNMGSASFAIGSIQTSGDYSQTNTCGSAVAGGGNCTISVTFTPVATGTRTGSLTITHSAPGSPHVVPLSGTGVDPAAGFLLSPTSLTFGSQILGSTSGAKTTTLTSNGTAPITIFSIAASSDFAQASTCGASLAPAASCAISVTFHPTATGVRNGTITITDDAPGTPHTFTLAGEGADFSVSAAPPAAATVTAGQTATYMLNVTPVGGFNQAVALACSGAPSLATCTISPNSVTPDGTNPASASVTVTTTAGSLVVPGPNAGPSTIGGNDVPFLPLWFLALATLSGAAAIRRRRAVVLLALTMLVLLSWASCGGGGTSVTHNPGTPAGTYTLTFTGTYQTLIHSTAATLTVNP